MGTDGFDSKVKRRCFVQDWLRVCLAAACVALASGVARAALPTGWDEGADVVVSADTLLDTSTPLLKSLTVANGATLTFTNWTTKLSAQTVTVQSGGTVTCAGPFNDTTEMSNRVWIAASEALTVAAGGVINVDQKGYGSRVSTTTMGYGPGKGAGVEKGGASHGGPSAGKNVYGDAAEPQTPGSTGATLNTGVTMRNGGGVVFLDAATATVTVNGTITANGAGGGQWNSTSASGGSVFIRCKRFLSAGGIVRANGGAYCGRDGNGAGGRIAIAYDPAEQQPGDIEVTAQISSAPGMYSGTYSEELSSYYSSYNRNVWANPGTVWFPDATAANDVLASGTFSGELVLKTGATATFDTVNVQSGFVLFGNNLTNVTVTGDVTVNTKAARLFIGASERYTTNCNLGHNFISPAVAPLFKVKGDFTVSNGGRLDLRGAPLDALSLQEGGRVDVDGTFSVTGVVADPQQGISAVKSWVYMASSPKTGGSIHIYATNVVLGAESVLQGTARGYVTDAMNSGKAGETCGPSPATAQANGAGHGGAALNATAKSGFTCDDADRPWQPGSSGVYYYENTNPGGGYFHLLAWNAMTVGGTICADGGTACGRSSAAAGGAIYLEANEFTGLASARLSAQGGAYVKSSNNNRKDNGSGGGGMIAVWKGAPGVATSGLKAYKALEQSALFAEGAELNVRGGPTDPSDETNVLYSDSGTVRLYEATPKGQNVFIRTSDEEAFGTMTPDVGAYTYTVGTRVELTAADVMASGGQLRSRCVGYREEVLLSDGSWSEPVEHLGVRTCTFGSMDEDTHRITWIWSRDVPVQATADAGGSVTLSAPPADAGWYALGSAITLTANADDGCAFSLWSGDVPIGQTTDAEITLTVKGPIAATAHFQTAPAGGQTFTWNGSAGNGRWFDVGNWANAESQAGLPLAGDTVVFPQNAGKILIDRPTAYLNTLTIPSGTTLSATNWTTSIRATTVTVQDGGVITCEGPFGDRITATKSALEMSNRVWIVCGELIVQSGGKIDADGKGYGEPSTVFSRTNRGYGPGRGTSTGLGGTHGGYGRYTANANVMAPYGAVDDPRTPGSSGGTSTDNWCSGYAHAGGGAILIEAEGQVAVEGTITAAGDYGNNDPNNHADGSGSGGSINVRAARFVSAAGQLVACGGSGNAPGGGGRIAILVDSEKQRDDDATAFTVNVAEGSYYTAARGNFYTSVARPGSFWSNDLRLYRNFGTSKLAATVYPPDADDDTFTWNGDLTVTNVHTRIPDSVKTFIVTGSVVAGGKSRFAFGAATAGGSSVSESVRFVSDFGVPFEFRVGGDFRVSAEAKGAPQFEFTAAADYNYAQGGALSVAGTLDLQGIVGQTSTVYLTCSPDRGNAFVLRARDMVIGAEAKIDADGRGYAQGAALSGTGIGRCDIYAYSAADATVAIGSGHGGAGSGATSAFGFANDSSVWPRYPGTSGGRRYDGDISNGGGYIHLAAERNLTLSGVLTACGNGAHARSFASAGGTVLLEAKRFSATATAQILARGGDHTGNGTGSGGGGIVSVFSSSVPYAERKSDRSVCELAASSLFAEGAVVDVRGGTIVSGDRAGEGCFHCWTVKNAGFMLIVR